MHAAIVALSPSDRTRVEAHLLRLSPEDRSLRFAAGVVTDETVRRYAASMDFQRDMVLGVVSKRAWVIGLAHGCVFEHAGRLHVEAAFSVDSQWRGHGLGRRLMDAVLTRSAAIGGAMVVGQCALRNLPMRRIFERAEMTLTRNEDELDARRCVAALEPVRHEPALA